MRDVKGYWQSGENFGPLHDSIEGLISENVVAALDDCFEGLHGFVEGFSAGVVFEVSGPDRPAGEPERPGSYTAKFDLRETILSRLDDISADEVELIAGQLEQIAKELRAGKA